jgi:serine/threonine protein kinase/Tfp pilus assembly protein PilF
MTPQQRKRVEELYGQLGGIASDQRGVELQRLCADDPSVRVEVEELFRASVVTAAPPSGTSLTEKLRRAADGIADALAPTEPPMEISAGHIDRPPPPGELPRQIGEYRITREINQGGMGVVYEARHVRNDQRVALKLIRPGFMTPYMLRRFEYEATVLARLDHPGIARVYYAGIFDGGAGPQPYFAMEYVEGFPLDEYLKANRNKLKLRQLVELFHATCEAVQHAHAKGIVHRDLKPDNILITGDGKPKVLDFGVARAVDADGQAVTVQSETGAIIGTVPYMAPEQIRGQVDEIEQQTDVYALGVIGYEIFADRMPYPVKGKSLPEAARIICEDEPSRLSSINKSLRGDVETIVQKALEKEKTRRYTSAGELAADVNRYLDYEPITARPPSTWYQLSKFAKRNNVLVGGVLAVFVVLISGVVVSLSLYVRAERQRAEAKSQSEIATAVSEFLTNRVLGGATPENFRDSKISDAIRKAMLDPAAASVAQDFKDKPLTEAAVRNSIARSYHSIGRTDLALPHVEVALTLRRRLLGDDHPDTMSLINGVGFVLREQGKLNEAEPLLREALERRRRALGDDHPHTMFSIDNLGGLRSDQGKLGEAEPLCREALERRRRMLGDDHPETLHSINNMGLLLQAQGRLREAEPLLREAVERSRRVLGDDHPETLASFVNAGSLFHDQGKPDEAEPLYREALERRRRVLGDDHPSTLSSINNMAALLKARGKSSEAEPLYREALERSTRVLGEDHPNRLISLDNLGALLAAQGKLTEAEPLKREALERRRRLLGDDHPDTLNSMNSMGNLLRAQGKLSEAEPLFRKALESRRRVLGDDHAETLVSMKNMGVLLQGQGKLDEAEPLYREALERSRRVLGDDHPHTLVFINSMGYLLQGQGKLDEAEPLHRESVERSRRVLGDDHPDTLISINNMGFLLRAQGELDEAEPLHREAATKARANPSLGPKHPTTKRFAENYARCLDALSRHGEAAAVREQFGLPEPATSPSSQAATAPAG